FEGPQRVDQQLVLALGEGLVAVPDVLPSPRGDVGERILGHLIAMRVLARGGGEVLEVDVLGLVPAPPQVTGELRDAEVEAREELDQCDARHGSWKDLTRTPRGSYRPSGP